MGNGWSKYVNESNVACASRGAAKCLALAYNERAEFAGLSTMPENSLLSDYQLDTLIPHFGKIVSGAYVSYTVESLYAELGEDRIDTRLASFKRNNHYYAKWFEQVIRVMNKLTFCIISVPFDAISGSQYMHGYYESNGTFAEHIINNKYNNGEINHTSSWLSGIDNLGNVVLYNMNAISTNHSIFLILNKFKNTTKTFNIYANVISPWAVGWYEHSIFNDLSSGFTVGLNLLFENHECAIDNNGNITLPAITGEGLYSYPHTPPIIENPDIYYGNWGYYEEGYAFNGFMIGNSNFKFIAGS